MGSSSSSSSSFSSPDCLSIRLSEMTDSGPKPILWEDIEMRIIERKKSALGIAVMDDVAARAKGECDGRQQQQQLQPERHQQQRQQPERHQQQQREEFGDTKAAMASEMDVRKGSEAMASDLLTEQEPEQTKPRESKEQESKEKERKEAETTKQRK